MRKLTSPLLILLTLSVLSTACGKLSPESKSTQNVARVTNQQLMVNQNLGDENVTFPIYSRAVLKQKILNKEVVSDLQPTPGEKTNIKVGSVENNVKSMPQDDSLLLSFSYDMIGEEYIFGSVITKVSEPTNSDLGGLKLTDLPAIHVRTELTRYTEGLYLTLKGCAFDCDEDSEELGFFNIPVEAIDVKNNAVILDLAALGEGLELIQILDGKKIRYGLDTVGSSTTSVEYSKSTLVFDIKTNVVPVGKDPKDAATPKAEITARWYLRLTSAFNSSFTPRSPVEGAGFFETERAKTTRITRFAIPNNPRQKIHYFIKNVPAEHKETFAGAFDNWNKNFKEITGRDDLLSYEFIDKDDPRSELIVAGDIRFNVMEWDLNNVASYGGLGPSIANQFTGETISANVLIQGPKIIEMYTKWFKVSEQARSLMGQGLAYEADKVMASFNKEMMLAHAQAPVSYTMSLGSDLKMNIASQREELEDPLYKGEFDLVPVGVTFESYMKGYFTEMLQHELGHNFGLRHNFKGNLGASGTGERGSVSRSIMEYLGRHSRHLNDIGTYDQMAIAYAYKGVIPTHKDWFCTDQDAVSIPDVEVTPWTPEIMIQYGKTPLDPEKIKVSSAECTKSDATQDPYSFWESRLARGLDLLLEKKTSSAPLWKLSEMKKEMTDMILGLANYSLSAEKTGDTWVSFFGKEGRPANKADVPAYVLESLKKQLCTPELNAVVASKESVEARNLAETNLKDLRDLVSTKLGEFTVLGAGQNICE